MGWQVPRDTKEQGLYGDIISQRAGLPLTEGHLHSGQSRCGLGWVQEPATHSQFSLSVCNELLYQPHNYSIKKSRQHPPKLLRNELNFQTFRHDNYSLCVLQGLQGKWPQLKYGFITWNLPPLISFNLVYQLSIVAVTNYQQLRGLK